MHEVITQLSNGSRVVAKPLQGSFLMQHEAERRCRITGGHHWHPEWMMNNEVLIIDMQSPYPRTFVCYECNEDNHKFCVGVPCHCKYCDAAIELDGFLGGVE